MRTVVKISMAYSPCPNDTLMFHEVAAGGLAPAGYDVSVHLHDVETLNRLALDATYDVTKVSFHAYLLVRDRYALLNAGAALGFGCGPLLVARNTIAATDLPGCRVAVPGELTTAHLLLRLWAPAMRQKQFVRYDEVLELVRNGAADCGLLIHESRFVYRQAGLTCIADLGQWWEERTGQPIPLGGIVARRTLGATTITALDGLLRDTIHRARANPAAAADYVRRHARETDEAVLQQHIAMFVTDASEELGAQGHAAVAVLERLAREAGAIP
jgi:1,4-dihydroxy-6-naphthoate synthase